MTMPEPDIELQRLRESPRAIDHDPGEDDRGDQTPTPKTSDTDSAKNESPVCRRVAKTAPPTTVLNFGDHYPDGGWGWVVCGAVFVVHFLACGLVYSYGALYHLLVKEQRQTPVQAVWLGSTNHALVLLLSAVVSAICRRKSVRLLAVVGAILSALGCLFISFSEETYQYVISYSLIFATGAGIIITCGDIIVGRYFDCKRESAEIVLMAAPGFGMAAISPLLLNQHGIIGWMRCLQILAGLFVVAFIAGLFYRSATIYHPRRKVLLHIKNTKRPKNKQRPYKAPYVDGRCLRMRSVQCVMLTAAITGFGAYTPLMLTVHDAAQDLADPYWSFVFPVLTGLGYVLGVLLQGHINVHHARFHSYMRLYLCQLNGVVCGIVIILLPHGRMFGVQAVKLIFYGLTLGAYLLGLKMLVFELTNVKTMESAWGFVRMAQSVPVLLGPVCSVYLSAVQPAYGYYLSGCCQVLATLTLVSIFFLRNNKNDNDILQQLSNEPHHTDVTVAVIPEVLGLAHQDLLKNMPVNVLQQNGNPVIMVNDVCHEPTRQSMSGAQNRKRLKYDRLKHKALNKLLQEINGHDAKRRPRGSNSSSATSPCRHPSVTSRITMTPPTVRKKSSLRQGGKRNERGQMSVSFTSSPEVSLDTPEHSLQK